MNNKRKKISQIVDAFNMKPLVTYDNWEELSVDGIIDDNRLVEKNYIFLALQGAHVHPIIFASQAVEKGALAIFTDEKGADYILNSVECLDAKNFLAERKINIFVGNNLYDKQCELASFIFSNPSDSFKKFAITGTNGKTTIAYIYEYCMRLIALKCGLIGTVEIHDGKNVIPSIMTTPQGARLQQIFSKMKDNEVDAVSMEVSSHALSLGRVDGIKYDVAAFSNLSQDHLDFHKNMQEYYDAKAKLFTEKYCKKAIISIDDDYGKKMYLSNLREGIYSFSSGDYKECNLKPDFYVHNIQKVSLDSPVVLESFSLKNTSLKNACVEQKKKSILPLTYFELHISKAISDVENIKVITDMQGDFNISNIGLALSSVILSEIDILKLQDMLLTHIISPKVPGRMEKISSNPLVIVDFAHNPNAMKTLFKNFIKHNFSHLEHNADGKLICIFGACGMRDIGKRPMMAEVATEYCDKVIVTNDDLHGEDQYNILKDTLRTLPEEVIESKIHVELDREKAIRQTILESADDDIILILGRGHETSFELPNGNLIELDDRKVAKISLEERNA